MKSKQIIAILGALFILIGSLIPLATLNNKIITYLPLWDNFYLDKGLWQWRDISFFAVSLVILCILTIIFSLKKLYSGLLFTGFISLFIILVLFMAVIEIKGRLLTANHISFSISWGWIILLAGTLLILFSGSKRLNSV